MDTFTHSAYNAVKVIPLRSQSECGKIENRKTPNTDTFHAVIPKKIVKFTGKHETLSTDYQKNKKNPKSWNCEPSSKRSNDWEFQKLKCPRIVQEETRKRN